MMLDYLTLSITTVKSSQIILPSIKWRLRNLEYMKLHGIKFYKIYNISFFKKRKPHNLKKTKGVIDKLKKCIHKRLSLYNKTASCKSTPF